MIELVLMWTTYLAQNRLLRQLQKAEPVLVCLAWSNSQHTAASQAILCVIARMKVDSRHSFTLQAAHFRSIYSFIVFLFLSCIVLRKRASAKM